MLFLLYFSWRHACARCKVERHTRGRSPILVGRLLILATGRSRGRIDLLSPFPVVCFCSLAVSEIVCRHRNRRCQVAERGEARSSRMWEEPLYSWGWPTVEFKRSLTVHVFSLHIGLAGSWIDCWAHPSQTCPHPYVHVASSPEDGPSTCRMRVAQASGFFDARGMTRTRMPS